MSWVEIQNNFVETFSWVLKLGLIFGGLGCLTPCNRGMYWWKNWRATLTDLCYWFVAPIGTSFVQIWLLFLGGLLLFDGGPPGVKAVKSLPVWVQCVGILLLQDVYQYWVHRLFHTRSAWKFHAIHHSPKAVDWLSAGRAHFVNSLLSTVVMNVAAMLLLGFDQPYPGAAPRLSSALRFMIMFNMYYSAMVHANLNWTFGPLRYVLASPVFHRWHHTMEEEGLDKNFAPTFPMLDVLFGTFYMPAGQLPKDFGIREENFPEGFWGQLIYPFAASESAPAAATAPVVTSMRVKVASAPAETQPAPERVAGSAKARKRRRLKAA